MKFNLNITDMTAEEFATVFASINIPCKTEVAVEPEESNVTEASDETINFDVDNLPWDARIHSSNHKINSDGRWQRRRGVSDVEFNKVKNELLGVQEPVVAPAPIEAPVVAPAPVISPELASVNHTLYTKPEELAQVPPYAPYTPYAPTPAPVTPEPVAPAPVQAPIPEPVIDSNVLFQTIVEKVKNGFAQQKIAPNDLHELVARTNTQFGTACRDVTGFKDNIPALQFIIDDLTVRGF